MNVQDMEYHLDNLRASDPDYVVDVLEISSEELVDMFYDRAVDFIREEFE